MDLGGGCSYASYWQSKQNLYAPGTASDSLTGIIISSGTGHVAVGWTYLYLHPYLYVFNPGSGIELCHWMLSATLSAGCHYCYHHGKDEETDPGSDSSAGKQHRGDLALNPRTLGRPFCSSSSSGFESSYLSIGVRQPKKQMTFFFCGAAWKLQDSAPTALARLPLLSSLEGQMVSFNTLEARHGIPPFVFPRIPLQGYC